MLWKCIQKFLKCCIKCNRIVALLHSVDQTEDLDDETWFYANQFTLKPSLKNIFKNKNVSWYLSLKFRINSPDQEIFWLTLAIKVKTGKTSRCLSHFHTGVTCRTENSGTFFSGFPLLINATYSSPSALNVIVYARRGQTNTFRLLRAWLDLYENPPQSSVTAQQHSPVIAYVVISLMAQRSVRDPHLKDSWLTYKVGWGSHMLHWLRCCTSASCEILTPITHSRQVIVSSFGAPADEWLRKGFRSENKQMHTVLFYK